MIPTCIEKKNPLNQVVHMIHPMMSPIITLLAGILILIFPQILNLIVAIYLIVVGVMGIIGTM